jgi:hypothetical protein
MCIEARIAPPKSCKRTKENRKIYSTAFQDSLKTALAVTMGYWNKSRKIAQFRIESTKNLKPTSSRTCDY